MLRHRLSSILSRNSKGIDSLHGRSREGLWGLLIFLACSAVALHFREQAFTPSLPAALLEQLGSTPPVLLVNIILGVSTISSLIIIAGKLHNGGRPTSTWTHLFFRLAFYLFYFIADSSGQYFDTVFISGMTVLALQHYNVWNYYCRLIEEESALRGEQPGACITGR